MTSKIPLILNRLKIRKMPGFPDGFETYKNFSRGINIIAGPNASGKSSTARTIQQLIWHEKMPGLNAEASATINNEPWEIRIDSGYVNTQHNGQDEELTGLPPGAGRNRYMLALHELVTENENDLARQIVKESIGGYDLEAARENLQYSSLVRKKTTGEYSTYEKADRHFTGVRDEQSAIKEEEDRLGELYLKKNGAAESMQLKVLYEKAISYFNDSTIARNHLRRLELYPAVLQSMHGFELTELEELEKEIQLGLTAIQTKSTSNLKNLNAVAELRLPEEGLDDVFLNDLESRVSTLTELGRRIRETSEKAGASETAEMLSLKNIGSGIDPLTWKGIDLEDVTGLEEFLSEANRVTSERLQWEAGIKELENDLDPDVRPADDLSRGIGILTAWLEDERGRVGLPWWMAPALIIVAAISALAVLFTGVAGLSVLLLSGVIWWLASKYKGPAESRIRQDDFSKTGLTSPLSWSNEAVKARLEELIAELGRARLNELNLSRINGHLKQLEKLDEMETEIGEKRRKWASRLPSAPANYSGLYFYLVNVKEWQRHHAETEGLKAMLKRDSEYYDQELGRIHELMLPGLREEVTDAITANTRFKKLESDERLRRKLTEENERLREEIREHEKIVSRSRQKQNDIYAKLGLSSGDMDGARNLALQLPDYKEARDRFNEAKLIEEDRKKTLEIHPLYTLYASEILESGPDTAVEKLRLLEEQASQLEKINEEIHKIESRVEVLRKGHNLEDAIAEREAALAGLGRLYEENLSSLTGNLIVGHLKKVTTEQNRPAVFKRAGAILNRITRGRYELDIAGSGEPSFRAYDTWNRTGQTLGELSTGTRLQLLLSVRLAYIETQEPSLSLPILADELLANCDDIRASAIIEALTEISHDGRQVFYFTAQDDEVARWRKHLADKDKDFYRIIRITGSPDEIPIPASLPPIPVFIHQVPEPVSSDHMAYGKTLLVPPFALLTGKPSQMHLWYLVEDNRLLYRLLTHGIRYYGQLESLMKNSEPFAGISREYWKMIQDQVSVLEQFLELYRTGRSRPADRQALETSGVVTDKFINEVSALLEELSGDPGKLLENLLDGRVSRFGQLKSEQLSAFFEQEGYLDTRPMLGNDEISLRLISFITGRDIDAKTADAFLKRLLSPLSEPDRKQAGSIRLTATNGNVKYPPDEK